MNKNCPRRILLVIAMGISIVGCKPAGPSPDLIKTQRETLEAAKAVGEQMQQHAQERMQAAEDAQK